MLFFKVIAAQGSVEGRIIIYPSENMLDISVRFEFINDDPESRQFVELNLDQHSNLYVISKCGDLSSISSLTILGESLHDLSFEYFPISLTNFVNLEYLEIRDIPFEKFRERFELPYLRTLAVINSSIREFPNEINDLLALENLTLAICDINDIEKNTIELNHLKRLDLVSMPIGDFPRDIFNMPRLTYLSVNGTHITEIPAGISKLTKLKTFSVLTLTGIHKCSAKICTLSNLAKFHCLFEDSSDIPSCFLDQMVWDRNGVDYVRLGVD